MKPRLFIGSSTEALDIAYAIQENLAYDSNPTVWTQGIFELSSNTLDDLLTSLDNFDFGIFVFNPDDVSRIRNNKVTTVRDNVIFELGLFIGKLGKKRVFFVLPDNLSDFHLPTDLLGVTPGKYNSEREDKNLKAATGPFCNQVRMKFKSFIYESLNDLENESDSAKKIALEKKKYWEIHLAAELLDNRLKEINRSYKDLESGLVYTRAMSIDNYECMIWVKDSIDDILRLIKIFKLVCEKELIKAFGGPGLNGNVFEIKNAIDKIHSVSKELLAWEYRLQSIVAPNEFAKILDYMNGWTKIVIDAVNSIPNMLRQAFNPEIIDLSESIKMTLTIANPPNIDKVNQELDKIILKK